MLGLGQDSGLLLRSLRAALAAAGRDRPLRASLTPVVDGLPLARLERPPESMRPDRGEVMNTVGSGPRVEIERGVRFDALVGEHNRARNLTTGLVTFATGSRLPGHTHPFSESITLLRGQSTVAVEGRTYELGPLDNIVIPSGTVHEAMNRSAAEEAADPHRHGHAPPDQDTGRYRLPLPDDAREFPRAAGSRACQPFPGLAAGFRRDQILSSSISSTATCCPGSK